MIEIVFLGTSSMQPTKTRNHSAILLSYEKENILFDCGEGTQRQMRIIGVKPAKITRLFISHWHGDHVFGVPGLLSSMGADNFSGKLYIYGPKGTKKYLDHLLKSFASKDIIPFEVKEIKEGIALEKDGFIIEARELKHSVPCLGYSFMEKDRRRIYLSKAKKLNISGPMLGKLQEGKSVLHEGKKINPEEVSYLVKGRKISYIADTIPCNGANRLASNADLLISEGTHLEEIKDKSRKYMHLTVKEAALIASENNAQKLIITHLSQRYKNTHEIVEEARTYFDNSIVAEDFMRIKL